MSRMVRKQFYLEARQDELLKRRARELGVTEAELVRRAVDQLERLPRRLAPDPKIWEETKALMNERLQIRVAQIKRGWTRDELYEERLQRLSR